MRRRHCALALRAEDCCGKILPNDDWCRANKRQEMWVVYDMVKYVNGGGWSECRVYAKDKDITGN